MLLSALLYIVDMIKKTPSIKLRYSSRDRPYMAIRARVCWQLGRARARTAYTAHTELGTAWRCARRAICHEIEIT